MLLGKMLVRVVSLKPEDERMRGCLGECLDMWRCGLIDEVMYK